MRTLRIALLSLLVITLVAISTIVSNCAGEDTSVRSWTSDATVQTLFGPVKGFKYEDTWTLKCMLLDADLQAAKVGVSDIELTSTGVIAATDREVFELIDSLAAQFVLRFVEWG